MAATDRPHPPAGDLATPNESAAFAARIIEGEALSIFRAVEERTSEMRDAARRDSEATVRAATDAATPARARLEALARPLRALSADLRHMTDEWARRRADDE